MGSSIARHVLAAGFRVTVHDPRSDAVRALVVAGATDGGSTAGTAARARVLVTSLPSTAALDEVVGELSAAPEVAEDLVETSTLDLPAKFRARDRLAARGMGVLDCPVSGTGRQMAERDAVAYVSGEPAVIERCRPVLDAVFRRSHVAGVFGDGSRLKYVANLLVAIHNVATAEALALASAAGLDPSAVIEPLLDGAGASRILALRGGMMVARRYVPPSMSIALFEKDLEIIDDFRRSVGLETQLFSASRRPYDEALARGLGGEDTAAVFEVIAEHRHAGDP
jgi:3-hydroxyisobutyrate dehydrogenase-like beta-hydroxyacid dehydrogenase